MGGEVTIQRKEDKKIKKGGGGVMVTGVEW